MEFVDYKCLESLLIEGEDMIATEGFIDTVKKKIVDLFKIIGGMISKLIGIIKAKFGKNKVNNKNETNESTKKTSLDTNPEKDKEESEFIKEMQYKKEFMENHPIKKPKKNGWMFLRTTITSIENFLKKTYELTCTIDMVNPYDSEKYLTVQLEKVEEEFNTMSDKCDKLHSIIEDDDYDLYMDSEYKEYTLSSLNELDNYAKKIIKKLENRSKNFENTYNRNKYAYYSIYHIEKKETHDKYSATYSKYISLVSKCSGLISKIITDIQNY